MNLEQLLNRLKADPVFMEQVTAWKTVPARGAEYVPFPEEMDPRLTAALEKRGIHQLYSHQAEAYRAYLRGEDYVVVTPTASGKTLCYNLPVLSSILRDPDSRALYLFPTKALSRSEEHNV